MWTDFNIFCIIAFIDELHKWNETYHPVDKFIIS